MSIVISPNLFDPPWTAQFQQRRKRVALVLSIFIPIALFKLSIFDSYAGGLIQVFAADKNDR